MPWIQKSLRTNILCTNRIIYQWHLNKAEESLKSALITWLTSRWTHSKPWTESIFSRWIRWVPIWPWVWDYKAKAMLVVCQILEPPQIIVVAAQPWTWLGQTESKCTLCRCTKPTLLEALLPSIRPPTVRHWATMYLIWDSSSHPKTKSDPTRWTSQRTT